MVALPSLVSPGWSWCSSITIDAEDEVAAIFGLRALVGAAFDGVERSQPGVVGLALNARLDELVLIAIGGRAGRDRAADLVLAEVPATPRGGRAARRASGTRGSSQAIRIILVVAPAEDLDAVGE